MRTRGFANTTHLNSALFSRTHSCHLGKANFTTKPLCPPTRSLSCNLNFVGRWIDLSVHWCVSKVCSKKQFTTLIYTAEPIDRTSVGFSMWQSYEIDKSILSYLFMVKKSLSFLSYQRVRTYKIQNTEYLNQKLLADVPYFNRAFSNIWFFIKSTISKSASFSNTTWAIYSRNAT